MRARVAWTGAWSWRGPRRGPARVACRAVLALALGAAGAASGGPVRVADAAAPAGPRAGDGRAWLSLGVLAGGRLSDPRLADYQWDTSAHPSWGAQALVGRGRLAVGARLRHAQTTQRLDLPGVTVEPSIGLTSLEVVGSGRLAGIAGTELLLTAGVGRLHLGYHPDEISIPPSGPGAPIVVPFAPIDEWTAGGGLTLRRPLGPGWSLGLGVDREFFGLDTAHRSGATVVYQRESLGDWSAHLEFARILHRH